MTKLTLAKEIDIQVQKAHIVKNKMNPKRPTLRYIIIKMLKLKTKNLTSSKRKAVRYVQRCSHKTVS